MGRSNSATIGRGVAGEDRHAHAGRRDLEVGQAEDLARFVAVLLFLVRLERAVLDDRELQRDHVVRNRHRVHRGGREVDRPAVEGEIGRPVRRLGQLLGQLAHRVDAAARHRLVRGDDQAGEPGLVVQRLEDRDGHHGRAVRVGHDALGDRASASALASGTTRGTSGSRRQADELSMTMAPAAARRGASSRDTEAGALHRAKSMPERSAVAASSTTMSSSPQGSVEPAERPEARYRMEVTGKLRSTRIERRTTPTWPVAPTMAMRICEILRDGGRARFRGVVEFGQGDDGAHARPTRSPRRR